VSVESPAPERALSFERLRSLERPQLIGLVVIGAVIVAGVAFWYLRSLPSAVRVESVGAPRPAVSSLVAAPGDPGAAVPAPAGAVPSPTSASIVVYVSGWVHNPGVYEFQAGDRVVDAIRAAGGAKDGADLDSVNLAQLLTDGEQVMIAKKGAASGLGGSTVSGGSGTSGSSGSGGASGGIVNLNTASLEELESLPGIGPSLGQRILDYRTQHGPFRSVDDLLNVSGIGDKRLADLKPLVTV
jgi:competence protein ComEA